MGNLLRSRGRAIAYSCAGLASGVLLFASAASAQNLLIDPGFEVSQGNTENAVAAGGDQPGATGWDNYAGTAYTNASIPHSGSQDLKTFGLYNGAYQDFTVVGGETFTATVWVVDTDKGSGGAGDILANGTVDDFELGFYTADEAANYMVAGADITSVAALTGGPGDTAVDSNGNSVPLDQYVEVTLTGTVPTGTNASGPDGAQLYTVGRVQLDQSVDNGGAAYWDDASVVLDVTPEPTSLALVAFGALPLLRRRRQA